MRVGPVGLVAAVCALAGLAGCSGGVSGAGGSQAGASSQTAAGAGSAAGGAGGSQTTGAVAGAKLTGMVRGGQQPIVGAQVYLLAAASGAGGAGQAAYGGAGIAASATNASQSLLTSVPGNGPGSTTLDQSGTATNGFYYATTDANGNFSISGDYTCAAEQQVYLYTLGGNAGAGANAAAGLMAALGQCPAGGNFLSGATPVTYVVVNEVSTVAAAYAMAGFATDALHVGSSGTALALTGIANAFANAANLETIGTGAALATTPAGNGTVPQAEIYTLANILAACVNSAGVGSGSACSMLFANATVDGTTTGAQPTDTATAAINIAHNPGAGVAALWELGTGTPPFGGGLTAQPNDFTVALNFTGGGLAPYTHSIAIDGTGNAWVSNEISVNHGLGSLTELSSSGAALSLATGFTGGGLNSPDSVALDSAGNVWVGNAASGLSEFTNTGGVVFPDALSAGGAMDTVGGLAIDSYGNVWASNYVPYNDVYELSNTGSVISPVGYALASGTPYGGDYLDQIAIDGSSHVWVTSSYFGMVTELSQSGTVLQDIGVNVVSGQPSYVAVDGTGDVWITSVGSISSTVTKLSISGTSFSVSGIFTADVRSKGFGAITIDGAGSAWIVYTGPSTAGVVELANTGALLSPTSGYATVSTVSNALYGVAVDGSGNVWAPTGLGVIELIGAAVPVITPIAAGLPATPTVNGTSNLGTRP